MLKKSCCCYSLEYGAVVIGITFFIVNSVGFLMQVIQQKPDQSFVQYFTVKHLEKVQ